MGKYGTHLPALQCAVSATTGPVLELGQGRRSTPFLDQACGPDRWLVSVENNRKYFRPLAGPKRRPVLLSDWDDLYKLDFSALNFPNPPFDVALIDHAPAARRIVDIARLVGQVRLFVVHDTESPEYGYEHLLLEFLYQFEDRRTKPWTSVVSNDLAAFDRFMVLAKDLPGEHVVRYGSSTRLALPVASK